MAGTIKVDTIQSDTNVALKIATANVAFIDATGINVVGGNLTLGGTSFASGGQIQTAAIADGAITTAAIADGAITNDKIVSVANTKITGTLGGNYVLSTFTSPGTWTKPDTVKAIKVTVVGGGGGTLRNGTQPGTAGGGGGASIEYISSPSIPGPVSVTVGTGGVGANTGGTSSFGPFLSATGGPAAASTGGSGSGGNINFTGEGGGQGLQFSEGAVLMPGGSSILGAGGVANANGANYGGGAGASKNTGGGSLAGGDGIVIVEEFY